MEQREEPHRVLLPPEASAPSMNLNLLSLLQRLEHCLSPKPKSLVLEADRPLWQLPEPPAVTQARRSAYTYLQSPSVYSANDLAVSEGWIQLLEALEPRFPPESDTALVAAQDVQQILTQITKYSRIYCKGVGVDFQLPWSSAQLPSLLRFLLLIKQPPVTEITSKSSLLPTIPREAGAELDLRRQVKNSTETFLSNTMRLASSLSDRNDLRTFFSAQLERACDWLLHSDASSAKESTLNRLQILCHAYNSNLSVLRVGLGLVADGRAFRNLDSICRHALSHVQSKLTQINLNERHHTGILLFWSVLWQLLDSSVVDQHLQPYFSARLATFVWSTCAVEVFLSQLGTHSAAHTIPWSLFPPEFRSRGQHLFDLNCKLIALPRKLQDRIVTNCCKLIRSLPFIILSHSSGSVLNLPLQRVLAQAVDPVLERISINIDEEFIAALEMSSNLSAEILFQAVCYATFAAIRDLWSSDHEGPLAAMWDCRELDVSTSNAGTVGSLYRSLQRRRVASKSASHEDTLGFIFKVILKSTDTHHGCDILDNLEFSIEPAPHKHQSLYGSLLRLLADKCFRLHHFLLTDLISGIARQRFKVARALSNLVACRQYSYSSSKLSWLIWNLHRCITAWSDYLSHQAHSAVTSRRSDDGTASQNIDEMVESASSMLRDLMDSNLLSASLAPLVAVFERQFQLAERLRLLLESDDAELITTNLQAMQHQQERNLAFTLSLLDRVDDAPGNAGRHRNLALLRCLITLTER